MDTEVKKLTIDWSSKILIFERAFNQYYSELFTSCLRKVQSEELAKDILQETFIVLWDNLEQVEVDELLPYLFGILRKRVLRQYRKSEVHLKYAVHVANQVTEEPSLEQGLLKKELETLINQEVAKMPARMQTIYLLKKESGNSIKEIAEKLGLSEQTVKNQLQNAYSRLRTLLKDYNSPVIVVGFVMSYMPVLLHR